MYMGNDQLYTFIYMYAWYRAQELPGSCNFQLELRGRSLLATVIYRCATIGRVSLCLFCKRYALLVLRCTIRSSSGIFIETMRFLFGILVFFYSIPPFYILWLSSHLFFYPHVDCTAKITRETRWNIIYKRFRWPTKFVWVQTGQK